MLIKSDTAEAVIGCAITVHHQIGPSLLESAYEACLRQEFLLANLPFRGKWRFRCGIGVSPPIRHHQRGA